MAVSRRRPTAMDGTIDPMPDVFDVLRMYEASGVLDYETFFSNLFYQSYLALNRHLVPPLTETEAARFQASYAVAQAHRACPSWTPLSLRRSPTDLRFHST